MILKEHLSEESTISGLDVWMFDCNIVSNLETKLFNNTYLYWVIYSSDQVSKQSGVERPTQTREKVLSFRAGDITHQTFITELNKLGEKSTSQTGDISLQ